MSSSAAAEGDTTGGAPAAQSEQPLGRFELWGQSATRMRPTAGKFGARYRYTSTQFPTMEIRLSNGIAGQASMTLLEDGRAQVCLGMQSSRSRSVSRHASPDKKHHTEESKQARIVAGAGSWDRSDGGVHVELTSTWWDACERPVQPKAAGGLSFDCVRLEQDEFIPMPMLACSPGPPPVNFVAEALSINPADTPRAGPFTLQTVPRSPQAIDPGEPWLLLGLDGALFVESTDSRGSVEVGLETDAPPHAFREADYRLIED